MKRTLTLLTLLFTFSLCFSQLPTKTEVEGKIADGKMFIASVTNASMASADTLTLILSTPNTSTWGHCWFFANADSGTLQIYEGITVSDSGTIVTEYNFQRNDADTSIFSAYHTPTVTEKGTPEFPTVYFGQFRDFESDKFVLDQNSIYYIKFTATGAAKATIGYKWFEK